MKVGVDTGSIASAVPPTPPSDERTKRGRQARFLMVGGICYVITIVINFALKWTVLSDKPTTALIVATTLASVVSYSLNKRWTFESRGGHHSALEMVLFAAVTAGGILVNSVPLYVSRYLLGFESPPHSLIFQEVADFISGPILGTALAMVFRWIAMDLVVFREAKIEDETEGRSCQSQHRPM